MTSDAVHTGPVHAAPASPPEPAKPTVSPAVPPAAPPPPAPTRHKKPVLWAAAAVGLVVACWIISWIVFRFSHSITDDAFVEAHIVNVAPQMVSGRIVRFLVEED